MRVAGAVLPDSPESSAALSRRALQELLIEKGDVKPADSLAAQIEAVLDRGDIPRHLGEQLDGIRAIGNFASHPIKSTATGTVMEVALGEAEWTLETLEAALDWYFVQAVERERRRAELKARLAEAGKPGMREA